MFDVTVDEAIKELNYKFEKINKMGYIEGEFQKNKGDSGLTFEKLIGKKADEFQIADYKGIEIKVKKNRKFKKIYNYVNLFNMVPSNCFGIKLKDLRQNYGTPDKDFSNVKIIMKSIFANKKVLVNMNFFELFINYDKNRIYLHIYDINYNLINNDLYWDFDEIEKIIERKLNYLAFIKYDSKFVCNKKYYKYTSIEFYKFKGFSKFLELLERGIIRINICLGVYKSGYKKGKEHDYGINFGIKQEYLLSLYDKYEIK